MTELRFVVYGRPASWQRTNIVNGRAITDKAQRDAKRLVAWYAIKARPAAWPRDREYAVEVVAYYPDRRFGDTDRIASLPLDALEGVAYDTDRQVARITCERRVDREEPRTEIVVRVIEEVG